MGSMNAPTKFPLDVELAAELLAIADLIDAKAAADAKFSEQFTAAMLADEREAA